MAGLLGEQNPDSKLAVMGAGFRGENLVKNNYTVTNAYVVGHPDALSTGDEQGKGETNTIGGKTDIAKRNALLTKNKYSPSDVYYAGHPDALSTGDELGKGETNTIGGKTDIVKRAVSLTKNKYNSGKEYNSGNML